MKRTTGTATAAQANNMRVRPARQPSLTVRAIIEGTKMSWPAEVAAPKAPMIMPRWLRNQRCATVAPVTWLAMPVPMPMRSPHSR